MIRDNDMRYAVDSLDAETDLKIYKIFPEAHLPVYGTEWAACFDLKASIRDGDTVTIITTRNDKRKVSYHKDYITIYSGERVLVPTGLIFDLDEIQSLRIHPRSGLAWKQGITVANCEGIVDADYVQQTYVMLLNSSSEPFILRDGDRVAQGEIVANNRVWFVEVDKEPTEKTDRIGGLGSTGVQ